jgi:pyruvate dehydrogenase E1 component alpha subunit/2-oxoisovalerate dehydrogenase E1 component alpha subunit
VIALHRQGRLGIYGSSEGEEAIAVAAAMALQAPDWIFPDYRVPGAQFVRGVPMREFLAQLFGTGEDLSKGRQLPTHHGSRKLHIASIASPVGNGTPHAVGFAWAAKLRKGPEVVLNFFGDGATSEEGFHSGMNIAGVHKLPVVFVCRNNQYAISVPLSLQTASETIAIKAKAYGFDGIRVDGSDALAIHSAVSEAVDKARNGGGPTLVEGVSYRQGAHSTSDDDTQYRDRSEAEQWKKRDPIVRLRRYLESRKLWNRKKEGALREEVEKEVLGAIEEAEGAPAPALDTMFEDVYRDVPWHLREQREELTAHMNQRKEGDE